MDQSAPLDRPAPPDRTPAPLPPGRRALLAAVALVVLALDLVTKLLVVAELEGKREIELLGGELYLSVSRNTGAAFSFAQGATLLFTTVAVVVVIAILRISGRLRSSGWAVSLGLLLGGASGNLVDRLFRSPGPGRGAVIDWIALGWFPSFNVADSGIVIGGMLAVLLSFRGIDVDGTRQGREAPPA
jgi:signal peptidase II